MRLTGALLWHSSAIAPRNLRDLHELDLGHAEISRTCASGEHPNAGPSSDLVAPESAVDATRALYTLLYMPGATRTQIYLTPEQRRRLDARMQRDGRSLAHLVREALDAYLVDTSPETEHALDESFGSLPDLEVPSRDEWSRG